jgi:hypothetical protein
LRAARAAAFLLFAPVRSRSRTELRLPAKLLASSSSASVYDFSFIVLPSFVFPFASSSFRLYKKCMLVIDRYKPFGNV